MREAILALPVSPASDVEAQTGRRPPGGTRSTPSGIAHVAPGASLEVELIDRGELARLLAVSPATVDRMNSGGRIPRPLLLSRGAIRWRLRTVRDWLAASEKAGRLIERTQWEKLCAELSPTK